MSLFSGMRATAGALSAFDSALSVVQNNVNNVSTPGFVKQTQILQADRFVPGSGDAGGVEAGAVQSARDEYAEQNVRTATSQLGTYEQQVSTLTNIQSQFDVSGKTGIPAAFTGMFSAFTNWASNPTTATVRQNVITSAQDVATAFQQSSNNLAHITEDSNTQINSLVSQVNTLATKIGSYNGQILAGSGKDSAVDAAINNTIEQLSEIASVTTLHQPDGSYSVMLGGHTQLVSGATVNKLNATVYVPSNSVAQSGSAPAVPMKIVTGQNDQLNLKIDGTALPTITLSSSDTTPAAVAADIQQQLTAAGSTATATVDQQGRLNIASGSTGTTASVEILAGNANSTLSLTSAATPYMRIQNDWGMDVTSSASAGGKLGGILQVRNEVLPAIQGSTDTTGSLNTLAKQFADRVNTILGSPLFTYDQQNATNIAASLQVNPAVSASQLASPQVVSLTGTAPVTPFTVTANTNDTVNLSIDGGAPTSITLDPSDTDVTTVATDLNTKFTALGLSAHASVNGNTGALVLSTTSSSPTASVQLLPGTANATLGLTQTTPTYQSSAGAIALALSNLSSPQSAADKINGQSYTQYFGSIAADVGNKLSTATSGQTSQANMVSQAQAIRQQVSGVDLNEEAAKVLQYQSAYQAASKIMTVLDTLTQTVLGMIPQG